jgi:hypothetical protein
MSGRRLVLYAGIQPGSSGTGQLVGWLQRQGAEVVHSAQYSQFPLALLRVGRVLEALREEVAVQFVRARFRLRFRLDSLRNGHEAVLLHPQTIGLRRTLDFVRRRRRPPVMFLLDSSFFCIRSYNHVPGMMAPCLECLEGRFEAIEEHGCEPFPVPDPYSNVFVRELRELVKAGRLHLVAQCASQARLASRHFGVNVPVVGLWTADWAGIFDAPAPVSTEQLRADVVFHGFWLEAKGARWAVEVARRTPGLRFLMPFARPRGLEEAPLNCEFTPMTWDTGLAAACAAASVVLVPSLWSAPVESAVIKSIAQVPVVAVVENDTTFAAEIPRDVVLHLPPEPVHAASMLTSAVEGGWRPDAVARAAWLSAWRARNEPVLDALRDAVDRFAEGDAGTRGRLAPPQDAGPPAGGQ